MKKPVLLLVLVVLAIGAFVILRHQQIGLETMRGHVDALSEWRASNAAVIVAGFFAVYVLVTALSLPVVIWMTLAGGALFGFWQGGLIVSFALLGVFAWIARMIGQFLKGRANHGCMKVEEQA